MINPPLVPSHLPINTALVLFHALTDSPSRSYLPLRTHLIDLFSLGADGIDSVTFKFSTEAAGSISCLVIRRLDTAFQLTSLWVHCVETACELTALESWCIIDSPSLCPLRHRRHRFCLGELAICCELFSFFFISFSLFLLFFTPENEQSLSRQCDLKGVQLSQDYGQGISKARLGLWQSGS